jgi:hypothetical protein
MTAKSEVRVPLRHNANEIIDGNDMLIARTMSPQDVVFAAFLCRAVNAHDELVTVVKALLAATDHTLPAEWRSERPVSRAKAALNLAQGGGA